MVKNGALFFELATDDFIAVKSSRLALASSILESMAMYS